MIHAWNISLGDSEEKALVQAFRSRKLSQGSITKEFEELYAASLDMPYAVAVPSGSMALLMSLMACGVGPGDEVIVPDRTFIATAHAPLILGAKVVLCDVRREDNVIDTSKLEACISPKTKVILPVHLGGRAVDMEKVNAIAESHQLKVIEDTCQAYQSKNSKGFLGGESNFGCFSLGVTKLMTTGQGGMIVTRDEESYQELIRLRNHGNVGIQNVSFEKPGFNFKFTDMQAALGIEQLNRLPAKLKHVREIYEKYERALEEHSKIDLFKVGPGEVPLYIEALCDDRDRLREYLESKDIQANSFRPSLHFSPHLENEGDFPGATYFDSRGIYLPCGPDQPLENIDLVLEALEGF